jgi:predicted DNA-binding transcriptional regulator AlpA
MANQVSISPRHPDVGNRQSNTVHGLSTDGRIRFKHQGQNYLVTGTLSERRPFNDASVQKKWSFILIATTPGYQPSQAVDKTLDAVCPETGRHFLVTGSFKTVVKKSSSIDYQQTHTMPIVGSCQMLKSSVSTKGISADRNLSYTFSRQLTVIAAQRAAGLDPDLRMSFIPDFLQESKATLYRKMGKGFPYPIKRGKGSFWPMSQIEAYKAGQLVGGAA